MPARDSPSPTPSERFAEARAVLVDMRKSLEAAKRSPTAIGDEHLDAARQSRRMFRHTVARLGAEADGLKRHDLTLLPDDRADGRSPFREARDAQGAQRGALISAMLGEVRFLGHELTKALTAAHRRRRLLQKADRGGIGIRFRDRADGTREEH